MPTNFTVVPVKDSARKGEEGNEEDDVGENNVLKEEEEYPPGEISCFYATQIQTSKAFPHFYIMQRLMCTFCFYF